MHTNTYIVVETSNGWKPSDKPAVHQTLTQAKTEAERLARNYPGRRYTVLEIKGSCSINNVIWT